MPKALISSWHWTVNSCSAGADTLSPAFPSSLNPKISSWTHMLSLLRKSQIIWPSFPASLTKRLSMRPLGWSSGRRFRPFWRIRRWWGIPFRVIWRLWGWRDGLGSSPLSIFRRCRLSRMRRIASKAWRSWLWSIWVLRSRLEATLLLRTPRPQWIYSFTIATRQHNCHKLFDQFLFKLTAYPYFKVPLNL